MSKNRRVAHSYTLPESAANFEIPAQFLSIHNEPFVLYHSFNTEPNRVIIFEYIANINLLALTQSLYFDGTFNVVPSIVFQLITIHAVYNNYIFQRQNYYIFWRANPSRVPLTALHSMSDFELASFQSLSPTVQHSCCFYHICQSILRKIWNWQVYNENEGMRMQIQMWPALAFFSINEVVTCFEALEDF
ncbi:hypothetical protein RF11_13812 [Thelohanellus kitauei]|uniref:MULE transposase domain-containing protein n=1 Tax=Thelohanellus kitauei TaxID=669202 RepID=A0A0C2MPY4_THEKT|nr:hypothetical protein RF11_13812 [Thelohanellus kitauei]